MGDSCEIRDNIWAIFCLAQKCCEESAKQNTVILPFSFKILNGSTKKANEKKVKSARQIEQISTHHRSQAKGQLVETNYVH